MEMHLPPLTPIPALEEQRRRRLFWEAYVLDRHTSTILGRPFAIADDDIEVKLPANLSDEEVLTLPPGAIDAPFGTPADITTPMAVFIHFVQLKQISSRTHTTFFNKKRAEKTQPDLLDRMAEMGNAHLQLQQLLDDIRCWRQTSPVFSHISVLYQRPQWYDFLYEKERLFMVRGILHAIPWHNRSPPADIRRLCSECATKVIEIFASMWWAKQIGCTRHYFQTLLTAGMLLAYYAVDGPLAVHPNHVSVRDGETEGALLACSLVLHSMGAVMVESRPYCELYELICASVVPDWKTHKQQYQRTYTSIASTRGAEMSGLNAQELQDWDFSGFNSNLLDELTLASDMQSSLLDPEWTGHLFADVEAYVNQFATGDSGNASFCMPPSWDMQYFDHGDGIA
jgi:hypothetical protein